MNKTSPSIKTQEEVHAELRLATHLKFLTILEATLSRTDLPTPFTLPRYRFQ